ncbi:MAG: hypothetical protein IJV41_10385 [Oscillospiraceae bacterium]|nr:hypothetical protein [Oscillospiraceae bacterium]
MNKPSKITLTVLSAILCFGLTGCSRQSQAPAKPAEVPFSSGPVAQDAASVSLVLSDGETALLDELTSLRAADLNGSENAAEIAAWAAAHPDVDVTYTVTLPDGTVVDNHATKLDLSAMSGAEIEAALPAASLLPKLKSIRLGSERANLSWDDVVMLHEALPDAELRYSFTLYGQPCDLSDTTINLHLVPVEDNAVQIEQAMAMMPNLTYVDMDSCGVGNERMAELRDAFPDIKVVWRVWFGDAYSVRTDVEMILASKPTKGGILYDFNIDGLYYCRDVRFLDLGHNAQLTDLGFLRNMPKLQTAIIAMCGWTDLSPIADCPELEYLEMQSTACDDLSPLSGAKNLRHLNIVNCLSLTDLSPLYHLTELDRLWVGSMTRIPMEQVEEMRRHAPDCEVSTISFADPTSDGWRYDRDANQVPRYWLLRQQFNEYTDKAYSFWWNDPLCPAPEEG